MGGVAGVQRRLLAAGHDPGAVDGVWGRRTIAAVRAFQAARGLTVDGVAGRATLAALGIGAEAAVLPWMAEARRLSGLREGAGRANNPAILDWAGALGIRYAGDDIAWCGLFVAHCLSVTLTGEALPADPLAARTWARFGRAVTPGEGAVMVFWRGAKAGWQGHVGFYAGEDDAAFHVLGGNQGDRVSVARIARDRLLAARWPVTAQGLAARVVRRAAAGALSVAEG